MKHLPLRELVYTAAFVILLAAIYMGSYYAMVKRGVDLGEFFSYSPGPGKELPPPVLPRYRWESEGLKVFFSPAHAIDRQVRPDYWSESARNEVMKEEWKDRLQEEWKELFQQELPDLP